MNQRRKVIVMAICAMACAGLSACGGIKALWEGEEEKATGERVAVFPLRERLEPDEEAAGLPFALPPETALTAWPRTEVFFRNRPDHISLPVKLKQIYTRDLDADNKGDLGYVAPLLGPDTMYVLGAFGVLDAHGGKDFGKRSWRTKLPAGEGGSYRYGGMLLYKGVLFITSGGGSVSAVRAGDGTILWTKNLSSVARAAPEAYGSVIFVNTLSNRMYALDIENGEVRWSHEAPEQPLTFAGTAPPAAYKDMALAAYSSGDVFALDAQTGAALWNKGTRSRFLRPQGGGGAPEAGVAPQVYRGYSLISGRSGYLSVNDLAAGVSAWEKDIRVAREPWAAADYLYAEDSDNLLFALHVPTGGVRWTADLVKAAEEDPKESAGIYFSPPVLAGGLLYVTTDRGKMMAFAPESGKLVRTYRIPSGCRHAPVAAEGRIYVMDAEGDMAVFGSE